MPEIKVEHGNVIDFPCDLLVMKYADGFHGADEVIAAHIGYEGHLKAGETSFFEGHDIAAHFVGFLGVGRLYDFRYAEIRSFGARVLALSTGGKPQTLALTMHGTGYGLDEREAFLSLVAGLRDGIVKQQYYPTLQTIAIVELEEARANRLKAILAELISDERTASPARAIGVDLSSFGKASEKKPTLFVAMPFADELSDVWDIAIQDSCAANDFVCERMDEQCFVGDIVIEIKKRISRSSGVIAVLDHANANVFLELGFAWGIDKPTILISGSAADLPFDVRGQRCLVYNRKIKLLTTLLTKELGELKNKGIL